MFSVDLTDEEIGVVRAALEAYLEQFGHDEAETVRLIKRVVERVRAPRVVERSSCA
ncbi:MAG: hypothetical protein HY553_09785 [Elusimicrobia bacterium]|nr:hypothetical protein [Elusimicrobiota bacterium]